jgi:hypothetical protein
MSDKKRPTYRMLTPQEICELERPLEWSPELVFHRLAEAVVVCSWVTQQPGPARLRGGWPAVLRRWDNMLAASNVDARHKRFVATREQIDRMEEAIVWPLDHLPDTPARVMFAQLVRVRAFGGNFRKVCTARGWGKTKAYEATSAALDHLNCSLRDAHVPIRA